MALWANDQANGFSQDPPNAVVTWVSEGQMHQAEVEVIHALVNETDGRIHYTLDKPLEPDTSMHADVSMFFDAMPTPVNGQITQSHHSPNTRLEMVSIFFDGMPTGMDVYIY